MLPPLFSLTNGKSFISPQNTTLLQFSQLYIIFKESLYTISTSVNPPDPAIHADEFYVHVKAISSLETTGLPGGMSTLKASVKPQQ